jgi:sugar/nucleoside kinase (ribokinase family)/DNA-binding CsgD family transcriptional regulator
MNLNDNEKKVLAILRRDPYISQQALADQINVSRPATANLISGLQQKGYILGKPYVLREENYITCIGGANMDVTFRLEDGMTLGTSNPVNASRSYGGVIRNVAENLARLEQKVSLMTLVGDDVFGQDIINNSSRLMETFASEKRQHESTGSYYAVIDDKGDMQVGFADMTINHHMTRSWILEHKKHLLMSSYMVADMNITLEASKALIAFQRSSNIPLAFVGVSAPKMKHLPEDIDGLDLLICNKDETQAYFKVTEDRGDLLCRMWLDKGVKRVVVTSGVDGSYYGENGIVKHQKAILVDKDCIVDVTGAGDAFSSGTIYGITKGMSLEESVRCGAKNASLTIQVPYAVNPELSIDLLNKGE